MGLEPFERHQANVGELRACGSSLVARADESIRNGTLTQEAYRPAVNNWEGMGGPELAAAQNPLQRDCHDASGALAWAAVVANYWADNVESFNREVDRIVDRLNSQGPRYGLDQAATDAEVAEVRAEVLHQARQEWNIAHNTYILDVEDTVSSMLRDGPTEGHVAEARRVGTLPEHFEWGNPRTDAGPWGYLNGPLGNLGYIPFATIGGLWAAELRYALTADYRFWRGNLLQPGINRLESRLGRRLLLGGQHHLLADSRWRINPMRYAHRAYAGWHNWRASGLEVRLGQRIAQQEGWRVAGRAAQAASRRLPLIGAVVDGGASAYQQWRGDGDRQDLDNWERGGRAAVTGVSVAGGAAAGAAAGAAIGSVVPVAGTAVGAVAGAVLGAGGAWLGSQGADWLNANGVGEAIGGGARNLADGARGLAEGAGNTLSRLNPFG